MKSFHNKSDDEINELSVGTSGGQPLKMRKTKNISFDGDKVKQTTEYITEGFKDDKNNFNRLHEFYPTDSSMTREDVFRKNVFENINEPFTSAIYAKINENGTVFAADCFLSPEEASAVVSSVAAMVGNYYKGFAYDKKTNDYDYDLIVANSHYLLQRFSDGLDHFFTDEEKAKQSEAVKRYVKKWQTKE